MTLTSVIYTLFDVVRSVCQSAMYLSIAYLLLALARTL